MCIDHLDGMCLNFVRRKPRRKNVSSNPNDRPSLHEMAGVVPPFGSKGWVGSMVSGKMILITRRLPSETEPEVSRLRHN